MAFALWLVVTIGALARGSVRASRRDVLVASVFVLLGFWARRNLLLVPVVTLPVVARAWALPRLLPFADRSGVDDDGPVPELDDGVRAAAAPPVPRRRPTPVML